MSRPERILHFLVKAGGAASLDLARSSFGRAYVATAPLGSLTYQPGLFTSQALRSLDARRLVVVTWRPGKKPCWSRIRITAKGRRKHTRMLAEDAAGLLDGTRQWSRWA